MTNYINPVEVTTKKQRDNLRTLSKALKRWHVQLKLQKAEVGFSMRDYWNDHGAMDELYRVEEYYREEIPCGTTCCAAGFAAFNQIGVDLSEDLRDIYDYIDDEFSSTRIVSHDFFFSNQWGFTDSPLNVALRIDAFINEDFWLLKKDPIETVILKWNEYIDPLFEQIEQQCMKDFSDDLD